MACHVSITIALSGHSTSSLASAPFSLDLSSGVRTISGSVSVVGADGYIEINTSEGMNVALFNTSGVKVAEIGCAPGTTRHYTEPGLYLLATPTSTLKVVVK